MFADFRNKKVLVTGGAGFIGSALIEVLLSQQNEVVCLDNLSTGNMSNIQSFISNPAFTFIEGDIRLEADCKKSIAGAEVVFHQAALGSVPRSVADPQTTNDVNISGFLTMLNAARNEGIKRFVYASSSSVYGDSAELPKKEENTGNPLSPYAVTKKVNELYARVFGDLYGMETFGLRYFNVFGRRQDPEGQYAAVIPRFVKALINHESPLIYGNGTQTRDFTYVDNVVQANILAATCTNEQAYNTAFNVACGERVTLNELFYALRDSLAVYDEEIKLVNPVYTESRMGDIPHSLASIQRIESQLGYSPLFYLNQGLQRAIQWYWDNIR